MDTLIILASIVYLVFIIDFIYYLITKKRLSPAIMLFFESICLILYPIINFLGGILVLMLITESESADNKEVIWILFFLTIIVLINSLCSYNYFEINYGLFPQSKKKKMFITFLFSTGIIMNLIILVVGYRFFSILMLFSPLLFFVILGGYIPMIIAFSTVLISNNRHKYREKRI